MDGIRTKNKFLITQRFQISVASLQDMFCDQCIDCRHDVDCLCGGAEGSSTGMTLCNEGTNESVNSVIAESECQQWSCLSGYVCSDVESSVCSAMRVGGTRI